MNASFLSRYGSGTRSRRGMTSGCGVPRVWRSTGKASIRRSPSATRRSPVEISSLRGSHPARNRKFADSPLEETVRNELVSLSEFPVSRELTGNLRRFGAPHGAWKSPQKEQDQSFTSQLLTARNRELFCPNRELDRSIRELFGVIRGIRSLSSYPLFPPQQPCDVLAATCRYGRHVRPRRVNLAEAAFWRELQ